eukprot:gene1584-4091_t
MFGTPCEMIQKKAFLNQNVPWMGDVYLTKKSNTLNIAAGIWKSRSKNYSGAVCESKHSAPLRKKDQLAVHRFHL